MPVPVSLAYSSTQNRVVAASMGGGGGGGKGEHKTAARVLGSGAAGILELVIFHPVDTVAKRLMSYEVGKAGS